MAVRRVLVAGMKNLETDLGNVSIQSGAFIIDNLIDNLLLT